MKKLCDYFMAMGKAFFIWRREPPLADTHALAQFCLQRASYVASRNRRP